MDAFQLAAAKQALLDTEIRKHRSSSFSAHVSHVVESANSRLAVAAAAAAAAGPTETSNSTSCGVVGRTSAPSQNPVSKILGGIVDRHENFSSMAYTKSPPAQCFGSVSVIEGHAAVRREEAESNSNSQSAEDTDEKGGAGAEAGGAKVSDEPEKVVDAPKLVMVTTSGLPASYLPGFRGRKHRGTLKNFELTSGLVQPYYLLPPGHILISADCSTHITPGFDHVQAIFLVSLPTPARDAVLAQAALADGFDSARGGILDTLHRRLNDLARSGSQGEAALYIPLRSQLPLSSDEQTLWKIQGWEGSNETGSLTRRDLLGESTVYWRRDPSDMGNAPCSADEERESRDVYRELSTADEASPDFPSEDKASVLYHSRQSTRKQACSTSRSSRAEYFTKADCCYFSFDYRNFFMEQSNITVEYLSLEWKQMQW